MMVLLILQSAVNNYFESLTNIIFHEIYCGGLTVEYVFLLYFILYLFLTEKQHCFALLT